MNIHAAPPLLSVECKLPSFGLTFLENLETDSGSYGMIASDLLRIMKVYFVVSLWTYLSNSGEVLDFLCHFYVHDKLTHASL